MTKAKTTQKPQKPQEPYLYKESHLPKAKGPPWFWFLFLLIPLLVFLWGKLVNQHAAPRPPAQKPQITQSPQTSGPNEKR